MFRIGCISTIVLALLGFLFEDCWRSHISPAIARRYASVQKQMQCLTFAVPLQRKVVVTRLAVSGTGNIAALKKSLDGIAKIEIDKHGTHVNSIGDFMVIVTSENKDSCTVGFVMHTLNYYGFQIQQVNQSIDYQAIVVPCANI